MDWKHSEELWMKLLCTDLSLAFVLDESKSDRCLMKNKYKINITRLI